MVNARMEHSGPPHSSDLTDFLANYERAELSCETGGSLGEAQDLPPYSETLPNEIAPPSPFLRLEKLDFLQENLEEACSSPETPDEKSFPALASDHTAGPLPGSQSVDLFSEKLELPQREAFTLDNLKNQDTSISNDATQALFWASILQAQMCVMDLQGEIDRQNEPETIPGLSLEQTPATPASQDLMESYDFLPMDSTSEESEELSERLEDLEGSSEEEEDEEVEYLFYNNPLFQESPHPTRTTSFEEQPFGGHPEGRAWVGDEEGILDRGLESEKQDDVLFYQTSIATSPEALDSPSLPELTSCPIPAYVPHYRSFSPLVITEGDVESDCSAAESTEDQECLGDQQGDAQPESILVPGAIHASDLSGEGLLFSASNTSLLSVLLQEPNENHEPASPAEISGTPPPTQIISVADVEPNLWQEKFKPQAPSCSHLSSSCAWVEEPQRTSCLQEEVTTRDFHLVAFEGVDRKLENSAEGFEMVDVPTVCSDEILEEEKEEEETTMATPRCSEEPTGEPSKTGETLPAKEPAESNGFLLTNGTSGDQAAAQRLAGRLYHLDGFKRTQVASFLRKNNEFSQMVSEAYLSFFQFSGLTLDQALRLFLKAFVLTGETQERERILGHFSQRYHSCNPEAFLTSDAVHTLTCAIMLLNTDLHGQNIGRSMTCQAFLANLEGMNDGSSFRKEQLKALYHSIRNEKLEWAVDEEEISGTPMPTPTGSFRKKSNPFLTLCHDPGAKVYHQGFLTRKVHAEADGKKTPWGKRGWKTFHTVLKGMVLYFFKDDNRLDSLSSEDPIGVHHALAERASKYTKRPNVFRLQTADWHVFLFQAPTPGEMNSWISRINLVAAMFSSPPFPAAVGSQRKFIRPVLPTATCKNSLEDQHMAHEDWMDKISDELLDHQRNLPDKRGRSRDLEEYHLKKEYLLYEKRRYETYIKLLEVKLSSGTEDLDQWEAQLQKASGDDDDDDENPGLKKSHSSPSLNADGPTTNIKVKRNISERRTVRKIIPRRNKHLL
ncbi:PH and SEC7 domain-containing protein 4 [Sphaerodactylus townsendi]|uniref:PH and SEC7 domain-containing protein 4 n=1 Tax=Sphaerodactylus townsendi TaxID=933632 RepID=UPI0020276B19|nr:PH and SEC7 domain-containing protein 4 [Sphaerodactylus townsendi]XP_048369371.1 PH and SEC7 domain-containing protein 4 [Sphaerodactylus townsendi]